MGRIVVTADTGIDVEVYFLMVSLLQSIIGGEGRGRSNDMEEDIVLAIKMSLVQDHCNIEEEGKLRDEERKERTGKETRNGTKKFIQR